MPTNWTNSAFGKGLRSVVLSAHYVPKIISFGAYQVFDASTYTGLQWFRKSDEIEYLELNRDLNDNIELSQFLSQISSSDYVRITPTGKDPWILANGRINQILNKIRQNPMTLADVFDKIFQGLATSKDDVYFIYDSTIIDEQTIEGYSRFLNKRIRIETGLVKPLLKGEDVHRYEIISTNRFVIFPYRIIDNKAELFTEKELSELYPLGYSYLKECEPELRGREKGRLLYDKYWYRYIYPKNLTLFMTQKLVAPEISMKGNFSYDEKGQFYSTTKVYGYIKKNNCPLSYEFLLGLLNSSLFWFFIRNTGYILRGGYFTFKTNYILPFPIPTYSNINNNYIEEIEKSVHSILSNRKLKGNNFNITDDLRRIDRIVLKIYDLEDESESIR